MPHKSEHFFLLYEFAVRWDVRSSHVSGKLEDFGGIWIFSTFIKILVYRALVQDAPQEMERN